MVPRNTMVGKLGPTVVLHIKPFFLPVDKPFYTREEKAEIFSR